MITPRVGVEITARSCTHMHMAANHRETRTWRVGIYGDIDAEVAERLQEVAHTLGEAKWWVIQEAIRAGLDHVQPRRPDHLMLIPHGA